MAILQALNGPNPGREFLIERETTVLGRSPDCDIVLEVNAVSRRHTQIVRVGGDFFVEDFKSRNGTWVNGELIAGRHLLKSQDQLKICDLIFTFRRSDSSVLDSDTLDSLLEMLRSQHVNFRGPKSFPLKAELLDEESTVSCALREVFGKIVVFDAAVGQQANGRFDMDLFLPAVWKGISSAFDLPYDESSFHPEQIAQALKSEHPVLFCLLNVQYLSEDALHCLRGLGFTQENHHVLYVGNSATLGTIAFPLTGESGALDDDALAIDTSSTIMRRPAAALDVNPEVKLRAMMEVTRSLATAISLEEVLPKILESLFKVFVQSDRGFIVMRDTAEGPLVPKAVRFRRDKEESTVRISRTVVNQAMRTKEALLTADADTDSRFQMSESIADFRIRSMMCAPLIDSAGNALGVIQLDTLDQRSRFQQDDLDLLASVATQAALAIERANLHAALLELQGPQHALELAANVQRGFLPKQRPTLEGYEFCDHHEAANFVGGDFLAYIPLDEQRLVLALGDVAGKGFAAALIMARLYPTVRYHISSQPSLPLAMAAINREAVEAGDEQRFVTLLLAELNARTHTLTLVNAGHLAPLLRRAAGQIEVVGEGLAGLPAGIDADASFEATSLVMHENDQLFLFTDGVTEVLNSQGAMFGLERLRQHIGNSKPALSETVRTLVDDAHAFAGGSLQDDFCLVACQRTG